MGSFSNYWDNAVLNHLFGKAQYTAPMIYLALSRADPGKSGAGMNEPVGNAYGRVVTSAGGWSASSSESLSNIVDITFEEATGSWGTITHFALFDDITGGNMLASGALAQAKTADSGDTLKFAPGDLDVMLD